MSSHYRVGTVLCLSVLTLGLTAAERSGSTATRRRAGQNRLRVAPDADRTWSFNGLQLGARPRAWQIAETQGRGKTATWQVMDLDGARCLACAKTTNRGSTFNLAIARRPVLQDVEIEVKVHALTGREDQGGGPIWRARDPNNYYIARWNPLEDNLRLYTVKNGQRKQLANADIQADPRAWHTIEIEHVGARIEVSFDDQDLIAVADTTFTRAGRVGLWTKADAATAFDDLRVTKAQAEDEDEHEDDADAEADHDDADDDTGHAG